VRGHAAHPSVLKQAGADDADMLVAVTQSDETNLVACRIASSLFNVPTRIARIRSADFLGWMPATWPNTLASTMSSAPNRK